MRKSTVLTWLDFFQFEQACQVLSEAGIPFERHGRVIDSADDPACTLSVHRPELRVLEQDLDRARHLLTETVGRGVVEA